MLVLFCETLALNEINEKMKTDLIQIFKNLRILAVNIISSFNKLRENYSYLVLGSKYNLEKLGKDFSFDRNYLIKMKNDLDFLKKSVLTNYFQFANGSDPFLISLSEKLEDKDKINVIINDDVMKLIKKR